MCTVSWRQGPDGYDLFCNRDESRRRTAASPPQIRSCAGVQFIAPIDTQAGGSWVCVNEYGVALCLLNGPQNLALRTRQSRGLLLLQLSSADSQKHALARAERIITSHYAPFTLLILEPNQPALTLTWNGSHQRLQPNAAPPLISSSIDLPAVQASRHSQWPSPLHTFHTSHHHGPSAYSVCMHRPDAETDSLTQIAVHKNTARLTYWPDAPCRRPAPVEVSLALRYALAR